MNKATRYVAGLKSGRRNVRGQSINQRMASAALGLNADMSNNFNVRTCFEWVQQQADERLKMLQGVVAAGNIDFFTAVLVAQNAGETVLNPQMTNWGLAKSLIWDVGFTALPSMSTSNAIGATIKGNSMRLAEYLKSTLTSHMADKSNNVSRYSDILGATPDSAEIGSEGILNMRSFVQGATQAGIVASSAVGGMSMYQSMALGAVMYIAGKTAVNKSLYDSQNMNSVVLSRTIWEDLMTDVLTLDERIRGYNDPPMTKYLNTYPELKRLWSTLTQVSPTFDKPRTALVEKKEYVKTSNYLVSSEMVNLAVEAFMNTPKLGFGVPSYMLMLSRLLMGSQPRSIAEYAPIRMHVLLVIEKLIEYANIDPSEPALPLPNNNPINVARLVEKRDKARTALTQIVYSLMGGLLQRLTMDNYECLPHTTLLNKTRRFRNDFEQALLQEFKAFPLKCLSGAYYYHLLFHIGAEPKVAKIMKDAKDMLQSSYKDILDMIKEEHPTVNVNELIGFDANAIKQIGGEGEMDRDAEVDLVTMALNQRMSKAFDALALVVQMPLAEDGPNRKRKRIE